MIYDYVISYLLFIYLYIYIYIFVYIVYIYIYIVIVCDHEINKPRCNLPRLVFSILASTETYETLLNF